jgi:hypothetical protein
VGLERGPLSLVSTTEELLVWKTEITAVGICHSDHAVPLYPQKLGFVFAGKRQSLGRYSSLAD